MSKIKKYFYLFIILFMTNSINAAGTSDMNSICQLSNIINPIYRLIKMASFIFIGIFFIQEAFNLIKKPDEIKYDEWLRKKIIPIVFGLCILFGIGWILDMLPKLTGSDISACSNMFK